MKLKIFVSLTLFFGSVCVAQDTEKQQEIAESVAEKSAEKSKSIFDLKPKNLNIFASSSVEYDDNVFQTETFLDNNNTRVRDDLKSVNMVLASMSFKPDEDLHWGFSYLYYGIHYRTNNVFNIGLHKASTYLQMDLDPDPIKLRTDLSYSDLWFGQVHLMTQREVSPKIIIDYSKYEKGELSYSLVKTNYESLFTERDWVNTVKYSHTHKFKIKMLRKHLKKIRIDLKHKRQRPDNDATQFRENTVLAKLYFKMPYKIRGDLEVGRAFKHYDRSITAEEARSDNKVWYKVNFSRQLSKMITVNANFKQVKTESNKETKNYLQNIVGAGLSASF